MVVVISASTTSLPRALPGCQLGAVGGTSVTTKLGALLSGPNGVLPMLVTKLSTAATTPALRLFMVNNVSKASALGTLALVSPKPAVSSQKETYAWMNVLIRRSPVLSSHTLLNIVLLSTGLLVDDVHDVLGLCLQR